ncbi:MAG: hypothetical protein AAFX05_11050, partial [Planctomycetota bacterium]
MAFGLTKTHVSPIAVDFGVSSLKIAQVQSCDGQQKLLAAVSMDTPRMSFAIESAWNVSRSWSFSRSSGGVSIETAASSFCCPSQDCTCAI